MCNDPAWASSHNSATNIHPPAITQEDAVQALMDVFQDDRNFDEQYAWRHWCLPPLSQLVQSCRWNQILASTYVRLLTTHHLTITCSPHRLLARMTWARTFTCLLSWATGMATLKLSSQFRMYPNIFRHALNWCQWHVDHPSGIIWRWYIRDTGYWSGWLGRAHPHVPYHGSLPF